MHRHSGASRNLCPRNNRHSGASRNHVTGRGSGVPETPRNNRHSGASRNPCPPTTVIPAPAGIYNPQQPSFRRKPESMPSYNRHSGESRNLCPLQPSFRRKPESMPPDNRHSGVSRNLCRPATVIPAPAGIYACRLHYSSSKLRYAPAGTGSARSRVSDTPPLSTTPPPSRSKDYARLRPQLG